MSCSPIDLFSKALLGDKMDRSIIISSCAGDIAIMNENVHCMYCGLSHGSVNAISKFEYANDPSESELVQAKLDGF